MARLAKRIARQQPVTHRALTIDERARLRPTVDSAALERLLDRVPRSLRQIALLHFYTTATAAETREALRAAGAGDAEMAWLGELADYAPLPPHLAHPENVPDPNWTPPVWTVMLSAERIVDPELRALWLAAEPLPSGEPPSTPIS